MLQFSWNQWFRIVLFTLAGVLSAQTLEISGAVKYPTTLSAADLERMPRASAELTTDGVTTKYEGVWLHEVLRRAGAAGGTELRGQSIASYVIAHGDDGYQVVFSLAEFDPAFTENQILVADLSEGKPLGPKVGPLRLVAPKEKRAARSVRMLTKLEVVQLWR
jgi:DMSO/TMAO reductase YedYZ molybdopterin-dependent catalytic subunit